MSIFDQDAGKRPSPRLGLGASETVSAEEARWIADRIGRDHVIRENERALLSFIKQSASSIHPELKPLLDKVG